MTLKMTKALLATTAIMGVAAASPAAALTIATSETTVQATSATTTGIVVTNIGSISVAGSSAIAVSSTTAGEASITVALGGMVSNTGASATISNTADPLSGLVASSVNVSGSVINHTAGGQAINLSGTANAATIRSSGTISGSITTGTGADVITVQGGTVTGNINMGTGANTYNQTGGTVRGNIDSDETSGADNVNITGGSLIGNIDLNSGAGTNNLLVSGTTTTVSGSYTGGSGADLINITRGSTYTGDFTLGAGANSVSVTTNARVNGNITGTDGADDVTVENATISGTVSLGDTGANTFIVSNSTLLGNYTGGNNVDTVTLNNATVSGTLAGAGGSSDVLNFEGGTYNVNNAITGFEDVNVNGGTVNVNKALSAATLDLAAGTTVNVNDGAAFTGITGALTNNGTLNLNTAHNFNATNGTFGANSKLGITVSDSTTASKLVLSGTSTGATSVTVAFGSTAGYIANGTSYTIISAGSGAVATPTMVTSNPLYTFQLAQSGASGGEDISMTLVRRATNSLVESDAGKSVASALDSLGSSATGDLRTIQNNITAATSAAQIDSIVESLTPATDTGAAIASANVGVSAGNNVTTRLASLRSGSALSGVATGSGMYEKNMWVQGFGSTLDQDSKDGNAGFGATSGGATFGMDTDSLVDGFTTGAAFTYAKSNVDSDASNDAQTDADTYLMTVYGSRVLDAGYFLNGQAGVGMNTYDTERQVVGFGSKTEADFDGMQYTAKLEGGRDIALNPCLTLTPLAGVQYTHLDTDGYTETGPAALNVDDASFDAIDLSAGAQLGWNLGLDNGNTLRPNVRAKYIYRAGDTNVENTSRFVAGGGAFTTQGVEADRSSLNLGAGLLLTSVKGLDLSLDYDADIRDSLTGHTGQVKVKMPF